VLPSASSIRQPVTFTGAGIGGKILFMKQKTAYAVFSLTNSGLDYMVKGNFGADKDKADEWAHHNDDSNLDITQKEDAGEGYVPKYPNGLFVKEVKY
jgi:hypothetical protein